MTGALVLREGQRDWTDVQRAALAQIGVGDAPQADQLVFLHVCQRLGLDPWARQVYMIGRKDDQAQGGKKWTIQTGIDGFRVFSERHPQYGGTLNPEWCGPDGIWRDVWLDDGPPAAARFTVLRKDQNEPIRAIALYKEYVQTKYDGSPNAMWKKMAAAMLAKCAEALARRRAFPRDLAGIYTEDEMGQADNPPPVVIAQAEPAEPDWDAELEQRHGDATRLKELLDLARGIRRNDGALLNRISQAWQEAKSTTAAPMPEPDPPTLGASTPEPQPPPLPKAKPVSKVRMTRLTTLLAEAGLTTAQARLQLVGRVLDRDVPDFADLSAAEVEQLIARLQERAAEQAPLDDAQVASPEQPATVTSPEQPATEEGQRS